MEPYAQRSDQALERFLVHVLATLIHQAGGVVSLSDADLAQLPSVYIHVVAREHGGVTLRTRPAGRRAEA